MNHRNPIRRRNAWAGLWVVLVVSALSVTPAAAKTPRLRRMVVVGDSLLSGFRSGGFVARDQRASAPGFLARRARVTLPLPLMDQPGVPPPYRIVDANRNGVLDAGEVRRPAGIGFRDNPGRATRHLAVPGETITSLFETIAPDDIAGRLVTGDDVEGRDILKFLILGLPLRSDPVSQVSRARDLTPSFILVSIGANDVLDAATRTDPTTATLSPAAFGTQFRRLLGALADTNAPMAVANLPDVTAIALLRRAAGEVQSCRAGDGSVQPVAVDDLLSIDLNPALLPVPPCNKVLSAAERVEIRARVIAVNQEIAAAIAQIEQNRGVTIASVDLFDRFDQVVQTGVDLDGNGSPDLTGRYLGGVFSLDGVHPTRTGSALIANAFIDAINARFGEAIPQVDLRRVASRDRLVGNRFQPVGEPPFGLFADEDLETLFLPVFDRIASEAEDFGRELRDKFTDLF